MSGVLLRERLRKGPLAPPAVVAFGHQLALAMERAQETGRSCGSLDENSIRLSPTGEVELTSTVPSQGDDRRDECRAFGALLYRTLTGSSTPAPLDPDTLPPGTSRELCELLQWCLVPADGLALNDIRTARLILHECLDQARRRTNSHATRKRRPRQLIALGALVLLVAVTTALLTWPSTWGEMPPPAPPPPVRFRIPIATNIIVPGSTSISVALSPDGRLLAVSEGTTQAPRIRLHNLETGSSTWMDGTEHARAFAFSPAGDRIAFFLRYRPDHHREAAFGTQEFDPSLWVVPVEGGQPRRLAVATDRGISWGSDDRIVFTPTVRSGLAAVAATGSEVEVLTRPDVSRGELTHRWPHHLPDGRTVLFTIGLEKNRSFDDSRIAAYSLDTGKITVLLNGGSKPQYLTTGHLIYARDGALMAVPFDPDTVEITGAPVAVVSDVQTSPTVGGAAFAVSRNGTLAYHPGKPMWLDRDLYWVDRDGQTTPLMDKPGPFATLAISPDGQRIAMTRNGYYDDLWIKDTTRGTLRRFTFGRTNGTQPRWTPDGQRIVFGSRANDEGDLFWAPSDGSGEAEALVTRKNAQGPEDFSPDGRYLAFSERDTETGADIWIVPLHGTRTPRVLIRTPHHESAARFSPDGHLLAYQSDISGRMEIYLRPFPVDGPAVRISGDGGVAPRWSRSGELFFLQEERLLAVDGFEPGPPITFAPPHVVLEGDVVGTIFDVAPDGERFLFSRQTPQPQISHVNVVLSWSSEVLRAR